MTAKDQVTERDVVMEALQDEHYDRVMLHVVKRMVQEHVVVPRVFGDAVKSIGWEGKSAGFYAEVIRLAFAIEAGLLARELAQEGHKLFPDDEELAKAARILAPPKTVATKGEAKPALKPTLDWFRENAEQYAGRWVAVNAGELVGVHETHQQLIDSLGEYASDPNTLVTKV